MAVHDKPVRRIVGRDTDGDPIAYDHTDLKALHLSGEACRDVGACFEEDGKVTAAGHVYYSAIDSNKIVACQKC